MKIVVLCSLLLITSSLAFAQYDEGEGDDDPRGNVHLGMPISGPLNPMAQFTNVGWGLTAGGGYNFTRSHAVVSDLMWNHLFVPDQVLGPIRSALNNPSIGGSGDLFALTGNYRYELRGRSLGTYFIAGGGWYHRTAHLSQKITTGSNLSCEPVWLWWGFSCSSGSVTANQTIAGTSASALGVNGGIGFTARTGEAPYRVYVESRYHYAPTRGINTQIIEITVGIRY